MTPEERAAAVVDGMDDGGRLREEKVAAVAAAIREAVAAETERCAKVAEEGSFLHADSLEANFGRQVAAAIRRGK
jgi:hypothetical protein